MRRICATQRSGKESIIFQRLAQLVLHHGKLDIAAEIATTAPVRAGGASAIIRSVEPASYILREIVSQAEDILKNRTEKLLGG